MSSNYQQTDPVTSPATPAHLALPLPAAALVLTALAILIWWIIAGPAYTAPPVTPATAPATAFSAERAREDLRVITLAPRPVGSEAHAQTRAFLIDRLRALGLEPELQHGTGLRVFGDTLRAGMVANIVARLRGTDSSGAVLLMAHYDSVPHAPGATDAGNGVTAILETVRALQAGPALRNDVIVLITDAEEVGLLGAQAYVDEHPWADDTGIVLNAEGRGYTGPVMMFRTTADNGGMIRTFAQAASRPLADSMANEVFRLMPNDTDLTAFQQAGYAGMDFANAHGLTHYHTPLDNFDTADPRSLQHHGNHMLELARAFGAIDLSTLAAPDRIYFTVPVLGLVHYPERWGVPLALLAAALAVLVLARQFRVGHLSSGRLLFSLSHFTALLLVLSALAYGGWRVVAAGVPEVAWFRHGSPYDGGYYLVAFSLMVAAAYIAAGLWFSQRFGARSLLAAPIMVWALLSLASALWLPGVSFLFVWPLLFALAGTVVTDIVVARAHHATPFLAVRTMAVVLPLVLIILALPVLSLVLLTVESMEVMLTMNFLALPMAVLVLGLGLLALQLDLVRNTGFKLPVALAFAGATILAVMLQTAGFDGDRPKPNGVNYLADVTMQEAYWYSLDPEPDDWTMQWLGTDVERAPFPGWATQRPREFTDRPWINEAQLLRTDAPDAEILDVRSFDGDRHLRVRLTVPDGTFITSIEFPEQPEVRLRTIGGRDATTAPGMPADANNDAMQYAIAGDAPAGIVVELTAPENATVTMRLRSNLPGLPTRAAATDRSRPPQMMAAGPWVDLTQLQRTIDL